MPSTNVFNKLCVKRSLLRSLPQKVIAVCNAVYFRFMHRFDAYSSTSYSRGIRWLPSPEVCRMIFPPVRYSRGIRWLPSSEVCRVPGLFVPKPVHPWACSSLGLFTRARSSGLVRPTPPLRSYWNIIAMCPPK